MVTVEIARQTKRIALTIRQRREVRHQALGRVLKRLVFVERLRERHFVWVPVGVLTVSVSSSVSPRIQLDPVTQRY